jgi:hypothetical protein
MGCIELSKAEEPVDRHWIVKVKKIRHHFLEPPSGLYNKARDYLFD